jgi:hypothetical protein
MTQLRIRNLAGVRMCGAAPLLKVHEFFANGVLHQPFDAEPI